MTKWLLVLIGTVFLAGCGTFGGQGLRLNIDTPDKNIVFRTDYQIENGLRLVRTEGGEYDIELGAATTKDADASAITTLLLMMQQMMATMYGLPPVQPPVPAGDQP